MIRLLMITSCLDYQLQCSYHVNLNRLFFRLYLVPRFIHDILYYQILMKYLFFYLKWPNKNRCLCCHCFCSYLRGFLKKALILSEFIVLDFLRVLLLVYILNFTMMKQLLIAIKKFVEGLLLRLKYYDYPFEYTACKDYIVA